MQRRWTEIENQTQGLQKKKKSLRIWEMLRISFCHQMWKRILKNCLATAYLSILTHLCATKVCADWRNGGAGEKITAILINHKWNCSRLLQLFVWLHNPNIWFKEQWQQPEEKAKRSTTASLRGSSTAVISLKQVSEEFGWNAKRRPPPHQYVNLILNKARLIEENNGRPTTTPMHLMFFFRKKRLPGRDDGKNMGLFLEQAKQDPIQSRATVF